MEKVNPTVQLYAQVFCFLLIWGLVLLITGTFSAFDAWSAAKRLPIAISIYALIGIGFVRWCWRWKVLRGWLIKLPDLQGTWRGELRSDWVNPATGQGVPPIPICIVIRQTFSSIGITLMTQESSSYSTAAEINTLYGDPQLCLSYTYTNRPKATLRNRSQIHDGAAILKIVSSPRSLEGEYWTSRKTRGDIDVKFQSRRLAERFS